jgi:hypothetical protein
MKCGACHLLALLLCIELYGCGPSSEERERQKLAHEAAMKKAIADSLAEEREKDKRMIEAAAAAANERMASEERQHDPGLAKAAAADAVLAAEEQKRAADAEVLRRYTDKLKASLADAESLQLRYAELSPKRNGMCALYNARDKSGRVLGYKRVVVTDARVATEESPTREGMSQYLLFQIAARDTGCFPDVQQVRILQ